MGWPKVRRVHHLLLALSMFLAGRTSRAQTATPLPPRSESAPTNQNRTAAEPASSLSLSDRRALMYLYFRLDQTRLAQEVAESILRESPADRETLKMLINLNLDRGRNSAALRTARLLAEHFPHDSEAQFTLARVHKASGQLVAAREVLREMKRNSPPDMPFAYEEDLAVAAAQSGDWPLAIASYRTLLQSEDLEPESQQEVRQQLDQLYRAHLPQTQARFSFVKPQAGRILRTAATASLPVSGTIRLAAQIDRDDITIERAQFLRQRDSDRYDAQLGLFWERFPWQARLWAGGSSAGGIFSGHLTRSLAEETRLTFTLASNQRSIDSLIIESLDGREDKAALLWSSVWGGQTFLDVELRGRRISLSGETLGYGMVASASLARSVPILPELRYGYRALVTTFSAKTDDPGLVEDVATSSARPIDRRLLVSNLVQPINLHGLFLSWEHQFHSQFSVRGDFGTDYSFERSAVGYSGEAGLSFFPFSSLELILEGGYSTSAETSNAESELLQFSFALRYFF